MPSFTKQAIIQSFLTLLNERPINQITVKDIVDLCGINRNSFYYHFEDIPSLVDEIMKLEAEKIIAVQQSVSSISDCLSVAIDFALKNKKAVMHIYASPSRDVYERYLSEVCEYIVTQYVNALNGDLAANEDDLQIIIKFYRCELVGYISDWLTDGMRYDISAQVVRLCELFEGATQIALERSAGKQ